MKRLVLPSILFFFLLFVAVLSQSTTTTTAATTTTSGCSVDSNCALPANPWAGATFCDSTGMKVMQYKITPKCISGACNNQQTEQAVKEDCTSSSKICDFTTAGGGVYACIAGTPPSQCAANSQITTRCICGSAVAGGAYYTWSGYDPGYCCGSGSNAYQISPGPCPTTTTSVSATTQASNQPNASTATSQSIQSQLPSAQPATTASAASSTTLLSNATVQVTTTFPSAQQPNCYDYCLSQPHILCAGSWKISGSYPNCECKFECETPTAATKPEKETTEKQKQLCTDSDGGLSIYTRGLVTGKDGQISEDKCAENNLIEFYCKDGEVSSHETNCANGCNDGACVSPFAKLIQDLIALLKSIFGFK